MHSWSTGPEVMADAEGNVRAYLRGHAATREHGAPQEGMPLLLNTTSDSEQLDTLAEMSHLSQTGSDSEAASTPSRHAMRSQRHARDNDSVSLPSSQVSDSYEAEDSDWDNNMSIGSKTRGLSQSLLSTTEDDEDLEREVRKAVEQAQAPAGDARPPAGLQSSARVLGDAESARGAETAHPAVDAAEDLVPSGDHADGAGQLAL